MTIAPLSMMQPAKVPIRQQVLPTPGPRQVNVQHLDAHQLHMQHLANQGIKPPVSNHANHLNHVANVNNAVNQYLTNDPTYQQQTAAINKALGDYQAQNLQQQNSYNSGYALNRSDLEEQQRLAGINQSEDYGSRGMLRSGLYAVDAGNQASGFARQFSQLDQSRGDYLMNLQQGLQNYITSQQLSQQQARQDAINRRALGLIGT